MLVWYKYVVRLQEMRMTQSGVQQQLERAADLSAEGRDKAAAEIYERLASEGSAYAKVQLGFMLQTGKGIPKSLSRAEELFRSARDQGSLLGKYFLGLLYADTSRNAEAFKEIREAAEAGYLPAIDRLGILYLEGVGCIRDVHAGSHYRNYAANHGHVWAMKWKARRLIGGSEGLIGLAKGVALGLFAAGAAFWLTLRYPADPRIQA